MSERQTIPAKGTMGSRESQTFTCVLTEALEAGDVPSSPTTALEDVTSGAVAFPSGLNGSPALTGLGTFVSPYKITQSLTGLTAGRRYRLYWRWAVANVSPAKAYEHYTDIIAE